MNSHEEVEALEKLIGQLHGLHGEIAILAKKSPSDGLNKFKLGLLNKVIETANDVLGPSYLPYQGFEGFDLDEVPSTSDVTLVLAQYMEEAERYRADNIQKTYQGWFYVIGDVLSGIQTGAPIKVGRK